MKTATYTMLDGTKREVEYDENAPCVVCGKPVMQASMGGTAVCPYCDCGVERPDKDIVKGFVQYESNSSNGPEPSDRA